mgnify:CR=1 FL=1
MQLKEIKKEFDSFGDEDLKWFYVNSMAEVNRCSTKFGRELMIDEVKKAKRELKRRKII